MKPVHYPDKWLRLIGIPFLAVLIRLFGAVEPIKELLKSREYYLDLGVNLVIVGGVWETNRYLIRLLDRRYSWVSHRLERFLTQTALALGVSFVEVVVIEFLYKEVLMVRPDTFSINLLLAFDLPLTIVFVVLINMVYTGMYLVQYHHETVAKLTTERDVAVRMVEHVKLDRFYNENGEQQVNQFQQHLIVNYGLSSVPVQTDEVAYIYKENEVCFLKTFDGKEFTSGSSLESLEALLNPKAFFRINRQMLAHIRSIKRFKQDVNGKLSVEFLPVFNQEVFVSKKKAPEFKEWLGKKI